MATRSALLMLLLGGSATLAWTVPAASQERAADPVSEAPQRGQPGWAIPSGVEPFVLRFEPGSAEIDEAMARTIDSAVAAYRQTRFAWLRFDDPSQASRRTRRAELWVERTHRVQEYLSSKGIRSVPLERRGRRWVAAVPFPVDGESVAGLALLGLEFTTELGGDDDPRPVPPAPPPPEPVPPAPPPPEPVPPMPVPPPPSVSMPRVPEAGIVVRNLRSVRAPGAGTAATAPAPPAPAADLAAVTGWLTATGTLTSRALQAMVAACERLEGELTADCQAAVDGGHGEFATAPAEARSEFSLLLSGCRTLRQGRSCAESVALEREFRALPRGRLDPQPLKMREGVKTTFVARIVYEGDRGGGGRPGVPIGETAAPPGAGGSSQSTVVPFSGRMCFSLTADPADFNIQQIGEPCPEISEGSSRVKYDPQWEVTPLRAGTLELRLKTELFVGSEKKEFRHEPYPLRIEVEGRPGLWDRIDATLARATGTVNLATKLATALGALFTAVAAWRIWAFLKKRRRKRRPAKAGTG